MNGTELITYLATNAPALLTAVGPIVGSILTAVFLRSNTAATEFEKVKSGKFDEVILFDSDQNYASHPYQLQIIADIISQQYVDIRAK